MGYDYSALDGNAHFRLGNPESSLVHAMLDEAELLDHETGPPPMPRGIRARYETEPDEGAGPIEWELSESEREFFGFGSGDPAKVPLWKLQDSEPWIVTPREARALADGVGRILARGPGAETPPEVLGMLESLGVAREDADSVLSGLLNRFAEFSLAASGQGGFWSY